MKTRKDKKQFDRFINDAIENTRALNETEPQHTRRCETCGDTFDQGCHCETVAAIMTTKPQPTPTPEVQCNKCTWVHEADSVTNTSFMGVKFCPEHVRAVNSHEELLQELRDGTLITDLVRERWTNGDLAEAVNFLMAWRKSAIKAIAKAEGK